jgi:hypothetical protein
MYWDWSQAGQDIDPIPTDEYGKATYDKKKGSFVWGMNVTPTYLWFNGSFDKYYLGDEVDPDGVTVLTLPLGDRYDRDSKIYPFKIHIAKQISDAQYNYLIIPDLFGGENSYWASYDWDKAARAGMEYVDVPYSGQYEFVETSLYESINHEVAPKEDALQCKECHLDDGVMDFAALGYEGDPMIVGERFMSEEEIEEIESMDTETTESETESSESSPGFEFFVGVFGLIAAVLILKCK